jgi:hypothetical protein
MRIYFTLLLFLLLCMLIIELGIFDSIYIVYKYNISSVKNTALNT